MKDFNGDLRESLTKEDRRERAMLYGTEVFYVNCPLCGMSKSKNKYDNGSLRFDSIDLTKMHVIVLRKGGGKFIGFHKVPEQSLLLEEIKDDEEYKEIVKQMKVQCYKILEELGEI